MASHAEAAAGKTARLRPTLVRLGPIFVKLGQYLALRPDVVPEATAAELLTLVDQVPPFPWPEVESILRRELGADSDTVFAHLARQPLAAGSLAQVHAGRLATGEAVAVKVRRPGIETRVEKDLRRLRWLLRSLELAKEPGIDARELHDELARWLREELDFERELRNLVRMHERYGDHPQCRMPKPYPELSSRRVLVAERLEGVPISELLRLVRGGEPERIAAMGYDRDLLAENLLAAILDQIFGHNLFHADTHPGNLIALADQRIGFVDFGLVEALDPALRSGLGRYLAAVYSGDLERIESAIREVLIVTERTDLDAFRAELRAALRDWTRAEPATDDRRDPRLARFMVRMMQAARRYRLGIPPATLSMYRSLLTAETVAQELGTGADLRSVGRRFFGFLRVREALRALYPEEVQALLVDSVALLRELPGDLQRVAKSLAQERLPFRLRTAHSRRDRALESDRARLLTLAAVSVGVAVLIAGDAAPFELDAVLWAVLAGLYLGMLVLWRRLR